MSKDEFKLITEYPITNYKCGARAGDRVRLRKDIVFRDHLGKATGEVCHTGELWSVLRGAAHEPDVIYLRQPDGEMHCWPDTEFFETFEILPRDAV